MCRLLDFPLNYAELTLHKKMSDNSVDPSHPPNQSDLLSCIADKFDSFGGDVKSNSLEFVKSSYTEAEKWMTKFEPTWDDAKGAYDLERYEKGDEIQWLCNTHGKESGLEKMKDEYA